MKCPRCGFLNPEGFAFCGRCGSPLPGGTAAPSSGEERKVVTILFADLTGSTSLAERLDPEQMRGIMTRFFATMSGVIVRHGGTVEKFIGDEIMAVFGLPVSHEDDPERAVRAAVEMQAELLRPDERLRLAGGTGLQMRLGINTGEVMANPQAAEKGEFMVTGDAVNVAARLRASAAPATTLLGERTHRSTEWMSEQDEVGPLQLKGKADAVRAWRLRGLRAEPARRQSLTAPLVGRASELALLQDLAQRAGREGRPQFVTIFGLPGVGKSRLFLEAAAMHPEATVRSGRSLPYGTTSMWAVAEILRSDCGILRTDEPATVRAKLETRIAAISDGENPSEQAAILTQLARVLAIGVREQTLRREDTREELFWALRRFVEMLAAHGLLILAFEDAHAADAELLDLVESLARAATGPIMLVCLARPELLTLRPGWGGGQRNHSAVFLAPLAEAATEELIEGLLSSAEVPAQVMEVTGRTGGNPLFVEEILRMLIDRGTLVRAGARWEVTGPLEGLVPDTVQGVITARLDQLAREEKLVALEASVLGKDFWGGALEAISDADRPALAPGLSALVDKDLIALREASRLAGQREYTFKHMLIRDVAYSMLPKTVRARKHRAFGTWLEQTLGDRAEEFADLLAYHWLQTTRLAEEVGTPEPDSAQKALRYALRAGHRAAHVYANDQALSHFQAAQTLATTLGADAERIEALGGQADVYALQARWDDASRLYQEALNYHLQAGNVVGQAKIQSRIGSAFSGIFDFRQALPHVRSAMEALQTQRDERALAAIYLQLARTHTAVGQLTEAEASAQTGLALARQHSLPALVAEGEWALGFISTLLGRDEAPDQFARCVEIAERVGELGWVIQGLAWAAFRHRWRGEYAETREAYARALAIAERTNNRPRVAFCLIGSGETHFLSGDWAAATATWERYLAMSDEVPAWVEHVRATTAFMEGNISGAVEWEERARAHAERRGEVTSHVLTIDRCATYYLRAGKVREARQLLDETLQRYGGLFWSAFYHPLAAEAALAEGDASGALEHCARAEASPWADVRPVHARLLRARGMIAASSGDLAAAITSFAGVAEIYRQIGQLYDCARAVEYLADLHAQRGAETDHGRARTFRDEAVGLYRQVGAAFELARLHAPS